MLVFISCRLGQNIISISEAKLELWTPKDTQLKSGFAINRTRTRSEMHKSTHRVVDYFIKTMLRNFKNALFLHDIAQATWGRCIFIIYRKILQNSKHLPSIYNNKVTVNLFSGHPVHGVVSYSYIFLLSDLNCLPCTSPFHHHVSSFDSLTFLRIYLVFLRLLSLPSGSPMWSFLPLLSLPSCAQICLCTSCHLFSLRSLRWMIPPMVVHPEKIDFCRFV